MKECKLYELDIEAKAIADEEWDTMPDYAKKQVEEFEAMCAKHPECTQSPYEFDQLPCAEFCLHYTQSPGYPGETLDCCSHPSNPRIIGGTFELI